jgi:hypothetical protein
MRGTLAQHSLSHVTHVCRAIIEKSALGWLVPSLWSYYAQLHLPHSLTTLHWGCLFSCHSLLLVYKLLHSWGCPIPG